MRRVPMSSCVALIALVLASCSVNAEAPSVSTTPGPTPHHRPSATSDVDAPRPSVTPSPAPEASLGETDRAGSESRAPSVPDGVDGVVQVEATELDEAMEVLRLHAKVVGVSVDEGTCSATATQGFTHVEATAPATFNVVLTECGALELPLPELVPGTWSITVSFGGAGLDVAPDEIEVTVP